MHELYPYQRKACIDTLSARRRNPLLVAPTGAGKTTMGAYIAKALSPYGVVWVAHRTELVDQAAARLESNGLRVGIVQASREADPDADVQVASVQTLARRPVRSEQTFIIDEAHRSAAESYRRIVPEDASVIGLTATPFRTDGRGLGDVFGELIEAATVEQLVGSGRLMDPKVYIVKPPDMTGIARRSGDYAPGESETRTNTPERRADIVDQWKLRRSGTPTLAFAVNVAHSQAIADAFMSAGVPAVHVDATTPADQRADAISKLASGEVKVISNVGLFTEGFDLPVISTIIDAAPTQSLGLHMQKIGRVMRVADGKDDAVVHDHAGNHLRLGKVTRQQTYSLDVGSDSREMSEPLGLTHCPECYRLYSGDRCPSCDHVSAPEDVVIPDIDGGGDLVEMTEHDIREAFFNRACEEQVAYDRKDGWILHRFKDEFGEWPTVYKEDPDDEDCPMLYFNPERASMEGKRAFYKYQLWLCNEKGWKPGAASHRYKDAVGCWPRGFVTEVKADMAAGEVWG